MKAAVSLTLGLMFATCTSLGATVYRYVSAETSAPYSAVINSDGSLTESGINYPVVFKPVPQASWVRTPWISPSQAYVGSHSIGMEVDSTINPSPTGTDKVNLTVCTGHDSFAPTFSNKRYLGIEVEFPQANFQSPNGAYPGGSFLFAQFWQGAPYHPPVSLHVASADANGVDVQVWIFNDQTGGAPSSTPVVIDVGTVPYGWNSVVMMVIPDYTGSGQVKLWVNGTQTVAWTGYVGYDPNSTSAYHWGSGQTPVYPNQSFNVYYGPYRTQQETKQQMFFDEIRLTDTYSEAVPGSGALP
jgi:hypothetical protein